MVTAKDAKHAKDDHGGGDNFAWFAFFAVKKGGCLMGSKLTITMNSEKPVSLYRNASKARIQVYTFLDVSYTACQEFLHC